MLTRGGERWRKCTSYSFPFPHLFPRSPKHMVEENVRRTKGSQCLFIPASTHSVSDIMCKGKEGGERWFLILLIHVYSPILFKQPFSMYFTCSLSTNIWILRVSCIPLSILMLVFFMELYEACSIKTQHILT